MPLADWQIENLCLAGMVEPFDPDLINPASIDVRLGDNLMIESAATSDLVPYPLSRHSQDDPYQMVPGQFVLAHSQPMFNLPRGICADFCLKSSRGREGLDRTLRDLGLDHLNAGFCDPGWTGSVLTLELKNVRQLHPVLIWPGMRIGQLKFQKMDALPRRSYAETGRYNGDTTVQPSRG
jgi:dCTP deaminase